MFISVHIFLLFFGVGHFVCTKKKSEMAIAAAVSNKFILRQDSFNKTVSSGSILPVSLLPDKKEWIAEHNLLMHMLDG
jgi:hypothetical protein